VFQTVATLVANNTLAPVFADDLRRTGTARARSHDLNRVIARRSQDTDTLRYLASPVTGMALEVAVPDRLCLLAWEQGARTPDELAAALHTRGLPDPEAHASRFLQEVAPTWHTLGLLAQEPA
jgi:hypothetical protein